MDLRKHTPVSFAEQIRLKVGGHLRNFYLPPVPDRLFEMLGAKSKRDKEQAYGTAHAFLTVLKRMSEDERRLLYHFFRASCPAELPKNVHINSDLLRRVSEFPITKIKRLVGGLRSLGFFTTVREDDETPPGELGTSEMLVLQWDDLSATGVNFGTAVASAMIWGSTRDYCETHGLMAWERQDFSQLAKTTAVVDRHPDSAGKRDEPPANKRLKATRRKQSSALPASRRRAP